MELNRKLILYVLYDIIRSALSGFYVTINQDLKNKDQKFYRFLIKNFLHNGY